MQSVSEHRFWPPPSGGDRRAAEVAPAGLSRGQLDRSLQPVGLSASRRQLSPPCGEGRSHPGKSAETRFPAHGRCRAVLGWDLHRCVAWAIFFGAGVLDKPICPSPRTGEVGGLPGAADIPNALPLEATSMPAPLISCRLTCNRHVNKRPFPCPSPRTRRTPAP